MLQLYYTVNSCWRNLNADPEFSEFWMDDPSVLIYNFLHVNMRYSFGLHILVWDMCYGTDSLV